MNKTGQLFEALMARTIQPDLSKASHRQMLEQVADNMLAKHKIPKTLTDYSKETDPTSYLLAKRYNKRMGHEAARTKAEFAREHAPKTRTFSRQELENKYKPWHQTHQTRGNSAELQRLMDEVDDSREFYLNADRLPTQSDDISDLLSQIDLLSAAHGGDGNALRDVLSNKTKSMSRARELYRAMYEKAGASKIKQLQLLAQGNQPKTMKPTVDLVFKGKNITVDPENKNLSPAIRKLLESNYY